MLADLLNGGEEHSAADAGVKLVFIASHDLKSLGMMVKNVQ